MASSKRLSAGPMISLLLLWIMLNNGLAFQHRAYQELEKNLLRKLGLNRKPVIDKSIIIPSATMRQYELMQNGDPLSISFPLPGLHKISTNIARTYFNNGSFPIHKKSKTYRFRFPVNTLPRQERLVGAEIRIGISNNTYKNDFVRVLVYDIVKPGKKNVVKPVMRLIDSKLINLSNVSNQDVISFEVTPIIERLFDNDFSENYGIQIQCFTKSGKPIYLTKVFDFETNEKPLLMIYSDDGTIVDDTATTGMRGKRSVAASEAHAVSKRGDSVPYDQGQFKKRKKSSKAPCQRYPMYVDFKEIGFDTWVQAPRGFQAYYCNGECTLPVPEHLHATNHVIMQTMVHHLRPSQVPAACCVPTKLSAQSLLYFDEDGHHLVVRNYPDMLVNACGCQ